MPDISALHVHDHSVRDSVNDDVSHLNLDDYCSPGTHKQGGPNRSSSNFLHSATMGLTMRPIEDKPSIGRTASISNLFEKINDICKTGEVRPKLAEPSADKLVSKLQEMTTLLANQVAALGQDSAQEMLAMQLGQAKGELDSLLERLEVHKREMEKTEQSLQVTRELVQEKTKEQSDMITKKANLTAELKHLEEALASKHKQMGELQISIMKLQRSVDDQEMALSHRRAERDELRDRKVALDIRIQDLQTKASDTELEISEVRKTLFELDEIRKLTEDEKNFKEEQLKSFQKQVRVQESMIKSLESQKSELGGLCDELQSKLAVETHEVTALQAEQSRLTVMSEQLRASLDGMIDEAGQVKAQEEIARSKVEEMRGQIKAKLMLIDSLAKEVERVESGMDLLALCGQFVAQVENALSDLAKRNAASFEVRKKVEVDIATLRQEIINETIKRQNAEAQVQAQQSVTDILKTDLSKLKDQAPEASTMNTIANLETLKSEFIDTVYQQLSEFKKLADLPSHKSKRDDKMSAILSALDHPDNLSFRGSDQQSFRAQQIEDFLNMQNRDMDMSRHHRRDSNPSVTFEMDMSNAGFEEMCNVDYSYIDESRFSRKQTPDVGPDGPKRHRATTHAATAGEGASGRKDFSDVDLHWTAVVKELTNLIQFIIKGSSIFANTVSYFVSRLPKECPEVQGLRNTVIK